MFRKQFGVIKRYSENFEIIVKTGHDEGYKKIQIQPEYPQDFKLPPLVELINPENYPQHEVIRWKFLKWISNSENIEKIPQKFLNDILVLNFLRREGFLEVFEADLILLSIKMAQDGNYEKSLEEIPEVLNPRAFKISFLFTRFHQPMIRCLKLAGLGRLKVKIEK